MEKRSIKNIALIIIFITYIFLYKLLVFPNYMKYSEMISASFLSVALGLSIFLLGFRKDKSTILFQNVLKFTLFYVFLTGIIIYGVGFAVGFLKNAYSREPLTLFNNIVAPIIIYGLFELVRYVFIWANRDKKVFVVLFTIVLIFLELAFRIRGLDLSSFESVFRLSATTIIPTIVKNIFFSYICYHVGYKVPLAYRLLVDVFYVYIVPIVPDLGEYIQSVISISLPILIYVSVYEMIDSKCNKPRPIIRKGAFGVKDAIFGSILIILIALVSGVFPLYMIGIGSASMKPQINKGDAVVLLKVKDYDSIKTGDIVAYSRTDKNGTKSVTIVHRVKEVTTSGGERVFVTKGDANKSQDVNLVKEEQIKGVVKARVPFIAYPTIMINELITNWR